MKKSQRCLAWTWNACALLALAACSPALQKTPPAHAASHPSAPAVKPATPPKAKAKAKSTKAHTTSQPPPASTAGKIASTPLWKASSAIQRRLKAEELPRTELLEKTETEQEISYLYRISPDPALAARFDTLCTEQAQLQSLDEQALREAMKPQPQRYLIPEGQVKYAWIKVPKPTRETIWYLFGNQPADMPSAKEQLKLRNAETGTVVIFKVPPRGSWRFDHLLEVSDTGAPVEKR